MRVVRERNVPEKYILDCLRRVRASVLRASWAWALIINGVVWLGLLMSGGMLVLCEYLFFDFSFGLEMSWIIPICVVLYVVVPLVLTVLYCRKKIAELYELTLELTREAREIFPQYPNAAWFIQDMSSGAHVYPVQIGLPKYHLVYALAFETDVTRPIENPEDFSLVLTGPVV